MLYELLAGRRPFQGDTNVDLSSAILRDPPPAFSSQVPRALVALIARCLEKDPARRDQRAGEVRAALEMIPADSAPGASAPRPRQSRPPKGRSPAESGSRAIAVLPLENLSRDHDRDVFADGMTDALINDLAQIQALRVISRTSAMRYKGTRKPIAEIARELSVDAIVEGTVLWEAGAVRVAVELVDAATDTHLWARSYEREVSSVLALQRELSRAIVEEIQVTLSPDERARLQTTRVVKADAYELWLRGRELQKRWTEEGLTASVASFQRAIDHDPGWAPAHAELAESFLLMATFGVRRPADVAAVCKEAAARALALDESLAEAHATLAFAEAAFDWKWTEAERRLRHALKLKPGDGTTRQLLGWLLLALGRPEESIAEQRRALHFNPLSPNVNSNLGWAYAWAEKPDRPSSSCRRHYAWSRACRRRISGYPKHIASVRCPRKACSVPESRAAVRRAANGRPPRPCLRRRRSRKRGASHSRRSHGSRYKAVRRVVRLRVDSCGVEGDRRGLRLARPRGERSSW